MKAGPSPATGDTVATGVAPIVDSLMGFAWDIPAAQAGGEYTVLISDPFTGDPPAERDCERDGQELQEKAAPS